MFHRYKTPKYYLSLSADDLAMVKGILLWWRNKLIREGKPTEDVDELILKLIKKNKFRLIVAQLFLYVVEPYIINNSV